MKLTWHSRMAYPASSRVNRRCSSDAMSGDVFSIDDCTTAKSRSSCTTINSYTFESYLLGAMMTPAPSRHLVGGAYSSHGTKESQVGKVAFPFTLIEWTSTPAHSSPWRSEAHLAKDAKVDHKFQEIDWCIEALQGLAPPKDENLGFITEPAFETCIM